LAHRDSVVPVYAQGKPPEWLGGPAAAVLCDLQGAEPIAGIAVIATRSDGMNGLALGIVEPDMLTEPLPQLEDAIDDDDLDLGEHRGSGGGGWVPGGGHWVARTRSGPELLARVAEILQEDLAETEVGWGQARPPCPHHPHPARPAVRDGEAWWVCERDDELLYRIGQGEVPTDPVPPPTWSKRSRRAEKRRTARRRNR
jgi:hypothetical protein